MSAAKDTSPIPTIRAALGRRVRDDDAPNPRDRSASQVIEDVVSEVFEIARTPDPGETQAKMLQEDLKTLRTFAQRGVELGNALSASGGGGGGRIVTILIASTIAALAAFGINGLSVGDDAAQARVMADQHEPRILALEERQQSEERRARRIQGLTVRWLGDTQERECAALQGLVKGINRLAPAPKKGEPKPEAIKIDCELATLPPELVRLVADLDIEEGAR
jgi:hypothetical protein